MSILATMTNAKLAGLIERRAAQHQTAVSAVYGTIPRNDVSFHVILNALKKSNVVRIAYESALKDLEDAEAEAAYRCGRLSQRNLYVTFLRQSPRFKRLKVAA